MTHESLKKNNSSWSRAHQPARENLFAPRPYNPQPQPDTEPAAEPEPYSREAFDLISSKFFTTPNTVQPKPASEVQESELESEEQEDKLEKDAVELQTEGEPEKPSDENSGLSDGVIQRRCSKCESESTESEKDTEQKNQIQTKLSIGAPGDKYEQEANTMAAKVMSMPDTSQQPIQRQSKKPNHSHRQPRDLSTKEFASQYFIAKFQARAAQKSDQDSTTPATPSLESRLNSKKGSGSSLDNQTRSFMEERFGADFSSVQVHTDSTAVQMNKELGAQAFTHGSDIFYGAGKTPGQNELTAHELTHVIQQTGAVQPKTTPEPQTETAAEEITDSTNTELGIQRLCSECEAEQKQQEYTGVIQAKSETSDFNKNLFKPPVNRHISLLQAKTLEDQSRQAIPNSNQNELSITKKVSNSLPSKDISGRNSQKNNNQESDQVVVSEDKTESKNNKSLPGERGKEAANNQIEKTSEPESKTETETETETELVATETPTQPEISADQEPKLENHTSKSELTPTPDIAGGEKQQIPEQNKNTSEQPPVEGEKSETPVSNEQEKNLETQKDGEEITAGDGEESKNVDQDAVTEVKDQTQNLEAESQEATTAVEQSNAEVNQVKSNSQNLKSQQISFAPPVIKPTFATTEEGIKSLNPSQIMGDTGNGVILYQTDDPQTSIAAAQQGIPVKQIPEAKIAQSMQEQRVQAEAAMSNFMASGSERMQRVTEMGGMIEPRISSASAQAKATIDGAIAQNQGAIINAIAQAKDQVQSQAAAAREQITTQYDTSVTGIQGSTATARERLITEHQNYVKKLHELEGKTQKDVDQSFKTGDTKFRDAGPKVAQAVDGIVAGKQAEFSQQSPPEPGNVVTEFLESFDRDTYVQNWRKAKLDAATNVGNQFKEGLIKAAGEKADELQNSKGEVLKGTKELIDSKISELQIKYNNALEQLNNSEKQALEMAAQTRDGQMQGLEQNLSGTINSLDQMQATQLSQLQNLGQQQKLGIDSKSQQTIAGLQQSVSQGTANVEAAYQEFATQAQGIKTPNLEIINQVILEAQGQLDQIETATQIELETGINNTTQSIEQEAAQGVNNLNNIGQQASSQGTVIAQEFTNSTSQMVQSATDALSQLTEGHTSMVQARVDQAVNEFTQLVQNLEQQIQGVIKNLDGKLEESAGQLEAGLKGSLQGSDQNPSLAQSINEQAEKAAKEVQPAWKSVLKVVIDIVITVAVTVAIAALAASGVGLLGAIALAALIGAAGGLLKQAANDMINGEMSSWQDYAMQAGIGAATGVLQLVGIRGAEKAFAAINNTVGKYAAKYAIEAVTDTVVDVGTQVASGKQFSLEMLGSSVASSLLSNVGGDLLKGGFGKLGKKLNLDQVDNKLLKAGTEFASDTISDTAIDVADKTLIKKEEFSLGMLGESAATSSLSNLAAGGANKLYGDKLKSLGHKKSEVDVDVDVPKPKDVGGELPKFDAETTPSTSKPKQLEGNAETTPSTSKPKQLEGNAETTPSTSKPKQLEGDAETTPSTSKPKQLEGDANQNGNARAQHKDKPEIEPGIVAKEKTSDGHDIKVLKDGRIVRCSDCGEIRKKYEDQLNEKPELKKRLDEIEKIEDPDTKAKRAQEFEEELRTEATSTKRKRDSDSTEDEDSNPSKKPKKRTGSEEAKSRDYEKAQPGYIWVLDENGNLRYDRDSVTAPDGTTRPKRAYDPETKTFFDVDPNVVPAKYKSAESERMKIPEDQQPDYDELLKHREDARKRRDELSKELDIKDENELKTRRENLEKQKKENPEAFTKEQQAELDKINERSKTIGEINEHTRKIGEKAAESYVKSKYPEAELVYGGPNADSKSGDFDQVWRVPAKNPGEQDQFIVIEAKGGNSSLGTRKTSEGGQDAQQGSRTYFQEIVKIMSKNSDPKAKATGRELSQVLRQGDQSSLKYLEVRAPITNDSPGKAELKDIKIKEFDISG